MKMSATSARTVVVAMIPLLTGCPQSQRDPFADLHRENLALRSRIDNLEEGLLSRDAHVASLEQQLQNLRDRGEAPPLPLFELDRIKVLSITSGVDLDGTLGDDGVVAYIRPVDRDGDVLKRAGRMTVQVIDPSTPGRPVVVGLKELTDAAEMRRAWYGKFMTNYYRIEVPFHDTAVLKPGAEVIVRVRFLETATGREFTADKTVKLKVLNPEENIGP